MKTVKDFKIVNGIATLEGVAYAEEAKIVSEFLKNNSNIEVASIVTKDGRHFELVNDKLLFTKKASFSNPYYVKSVEETGQSQSSTIEETQQIQSLIINEKNSNSLEQRVITIENKLLETKEILNSIKVDLDVLSNKIEELVDLTNSVNTSKRNKDLQKILAGKI